MIYLQKSDDLTRLPLKPETITRLRELGVNTIWELFDDPHDIAEAVQWADWLCQGCTEYVLLEWGMELPARSGQLYWELDEGILTVYGTGVMMDYTDRFQPPWDALREDILCFRTSGHVENIGARAFENCPYLAWIELSEHTTRIGTGAFRNCVRLTEIHCPQTLVHCREASAYTTDDLVAFVGNKAFAGTGLPKAEFGDFYRIGGVLMEYFGDGGDVVIPEGVEEISPMAFEDAGIRSVKLPRSLKRIGLCAFQGNHLRELILPAGLEYVGPWAFHGIRELEQVTLLGRRTVIDSTAFAATPVEAQSRTEDGRWPSRYRLRLVEEPGMEPYRLVVMAENPEVCFGTKALNLRSALRELLFRGGNTLVQFFPDWNQTGHTPILVHRYSWWWAPPDLEAIADHLPEEALDELYPWLVFWVPDEDAPISTAGLCRKRRKNTPVWYACSGRDKGASEVGLEFLKLKYTPVQPSEQTE